MKISWISSYFQSLSPIITRTNVRVNAILRGIASTASVATLAKTAWVDRDFLAVQQANPVSTHTEKQSVPADR